MGLEFRLFITWVGVQAHYAVVEAFAGDVSLARLLVLLDVSVSAQLLLELAVRAPRVIETLVRILRLRDVKLHSEVHILKVRSLVP